MNTEFDPTKLDPNTELSDEQRLLLQQQDEQRAGDENEAKGFNRDGSPKTPPVTPAPVVVTPSQPVSQGPATLQNLRETPLGTGIRDAAPASTSLSEEALRVKEKLSKQPKLPIFLPLEAGERKGISYRSVVINGYRFEVKKGIMVYVPQAVHDLLINAMQASAEATEVEENLSDADGAKRRALGLE